MPQQYLCHGEASGIRGHLLTCYAQRRPARPGWSRGRVRVRVVSPVHTLTPPRSPATRTTIQEPSSLPSPSPSPFSSDNGCPTKLTIQTLRTNASATSSDKTILSRCAVAFLPRSSGTFTATASELWSATWLLGAGSVSVGVSFALMQEE